jgi:hypothetical protein
MKAWAALARQEQNAPLTTGADLASSLWRQKSVDDRVATGFSPVLDCGRKTKVIRRIRKVLRLVSECPRPLSAVLTNITMAPCAIARVRGADGRIDREERAGARSERRSWPSEVRRRVERATRAARCHWRGPFRQRAQARSPDLL